MTDLDFAVLYLPEDTSEHYCVDYLPDPEDYPHNSVLLCGKCDQAWFNDYGHEFHIWRRLRWYHSRLRRQVKNYGR